MALEIRPLSPHLGAEIIGLDLHESFDEDTAAQLRQAYRDHHLLLVRQDGVTEEEQVRFSKLFGDLLVRNSYDGSRGLEAHYISNSRPDGVLPIGEIEFHHDQIFYEKPLKAGILYAIEVPASGSATRFRNVSALLDKIPEELRGKAENIRCLHFFSYGEGDYSAKQDPNKETAKSQRAWQPLIWTDPETGRKAVWAARITTVDYEGISKSEGEQLLQHLWQIAEDSDELSYTHRWRTGDLLVWDNRMLAHARLPFQSSEPRTLRRTSAI
ncbi:taurine dioxygenase [Rhizobiales bacterium GAS113]|nr:taurine dioxygenase [Rhizobiales bacterium GAS113]SEE72182.1 taurine dioxygenase [Rhizobiales bacterium GAS188]